MTVWESGMAVCCGVSVLTGAWRPEPRERLVWVGALRMLTSCDGSAHRQTRHRVRAAGSSGLIKLTRCYSVCSARLLEFSLFLNITLLDYAEPMLSQFIIHPLSRTVLAVGLVQLDTEYSPSGKLSFRVAGEKIQWLYCSQ